MHRYNSQRAAENDDDDDDDDDNECIECFFIINICTVTTSHKNN